MPRATTIFRKGRKALEDLHLRDILQTEILHELAHPRFQDNQSSSEGEFVVDWDSPESQDVVLRTKYKSGEEVAVSALLGPETYAEGTTFPREVLMKVCVTKPGLSSILQFDCTVFESGRNKSEFNIRNAYYLPSHTYSQPSVYRGPFFRSLDHRLQEALKEYLKSRGVGGSLTNFLLLHLHKREQGQYVNWLQKLESSIVEGV